MEHRPEPPDQPQHHQLHQHPRHHGLSSFPAGLPSPYASPGYAGEELQSHALPFLVPQHLYQQSFQPADDGSFEQYIPSSSFDAPYPPLPLDDHSEALVAVAAFSPAAADSADCAASYSLSSSSSSSSPSASPLFFSPQSDSTMKDEDSSPFQVESSTSLITSHSSGPVKRRRVSSLTSQQREALNRQKHKEIDAQRRRREAAVVKQLDQLIDERDDEDDAGEAAEASNDADSSSRADSGSEEKRDKVTILERSVEELQRLRCLYRKLRRVCNAKDRRIQQLAHHLHAVSSSSSSPLLPPATASYLAFLDNDHSVHSSLFLRSPLSLMLLTGGVLIDVNARFLSCTGWQREDIVNMRCSPPYNTGSAERISPLMRKHLLDPLSGEVLTTRFCVQYPSAKQQFAKIFTGEQKKVEAVLRMYVPSGRIIEATYSAWKDGDNMVLASVVEDGLLLDDTSINSGYDETDDDMEYNKYGTDTTDSDSSSSGNSSTAIMRSKQ